jgi:hypothetical protein
MVYTAAMSAPDPFRHALMASFYQDHRPELADLVASAGLCLDAPGLWVQPAPEFDGISPQFLEPLLRAAAAEAGLPLAWIHLVGARSATPV